MARTSKQVLILLVLLASIALVTKWLNPSDPLPKYLRETDGTQEAVIGVMGRVQASLDDSLKDESADMTELDSKLSEWADQIDNQWKRLEKCDVPTEAKTLHYSLGCWHTDLASFTRAQSARVGALKNSRRALEGYNVRSPASKRFQFEKAQATAMTTFSMSVMQIKEIKRLEDEIAAERLRLGAKTPTRRVELGDVAYPP